MGAITMPSNESQDKTTGELRTEIRHLRQSVHELSEAVEELVENQTKQNSGRGGGPPEHAAAASKRATQARDAVGEVVPEDEQMGPPWERAGYDTKEAWMAARGVNGE